MTETITSRKNEKILHIKKLFSSSSYRREHGEFACDGEKLLKEALAHDIKVKTVLKCGDISLKLPENVKAFNVSEDIINFVSPMKTPQRVLFSCEMIENEEFKNFSGSGIIIENIQDPGNVGTIIRTANAFSIKNVVLVGACADIYNPKTIRASMGAVFRQKIMTASTADIKLAKDAGKRIFAAALASDSEDMRNIDLRDSAVVIGNEGSGISEEMLEICDKKLIIPMNRDCESLNAGAAAAVIMWEIGKSAL